jgi:hypothetical protein
VGFNWHHVQVRDSQADRINETGPPSCNHRVTYMKDCQWLETQLQLQLACSNCVGSFGQSNMYRRACQLDAQPDVAS